MGGGGGRERKRTDVPGVMDFFPFLSIFLFFEVNELPGGWRTWYPVVGYKLQDV